MEGRSDCCAKTTHNIQEGCINICSLALSLFSTAFPPNCRDPYCFDHIPIAVTSFHPLWFHHDSMVPGFGTWFRRFLVRGTDLDLESVGGRGVGWGLAMSGK